jgi:malonate decarboxylase beta subunit
MTAPAPPQRASWYEMSARQRIAAFADEGSFSELIGPAERQVSPHLALFDLPVQFDDGVIVGPARLDGQPVLLAAQEGRFMGGAFGEVHGAKLTGLLRAARAMARDVVILFDTGGVRLQEANAGEIAIAEIMRALLEARLAGRQVVGLVGGRAGCFGGGGLIAACCSHLVVSEQGRISVTGPEVIETNQGVEEFDSADRALVWRTMGGKHRYLLGGADSFVEDNPAAFRSAALAALATGHGLTAGTIRAEQQRLKWRLARFGHCGDADEVRTAQGIADPARIADLTTEQFLVLADPLREHADAAR